MRTQPFVGGIVTYTCDIAEQSGYLLVKAVGTMDSFDVMLDYAKTVLAAIESTGGKTLMLDHRSLRFKMFSLDAIDLAAWLEEREVQSMGLRTAVLPAKGDMLIGKFFETVFVNRSLQLRVFSDEEAAARWLSERS